MNIEVGSVLNDYLKNILKETDTFFHVANIISEQPWQYRRHPSGWGHRSGNGALREWYQNVKPQTTARNDLPNMYVRDARPSALEFLNGKLWSTENVKEHLGMQCYSRCYARMNEEIPSNSYYHAVLFSYHWMCFKVGTLDFTTD